MKMFYSPNDSYNNTEMDKTFRFLSGCETFESKDLEVMEVGRILNIKQCGGGVAVFDFKDICEGIYGSPDYITICRSFHTVILKNVKKLKPEDRNTMKRFVTFVKCEG